jgi:putative transcriptional regulator
MAFGRFGRATLALGALLFWATLAAGALPKPDVTPDTSPAPPSLAGQLLIASPEIGDIRFRHTVILMIRHTKDGALGIVINRPIEERSLASLMEAIGEDGTGIEGNVRIFAGGPVSARSGFIVHTPDYHRPETIDIDGRVAMTTNPEILRDIGHSAGPAKSLIAFGYAGWGPGQLENELDRHGWLTAPEDPALIFDDDRDKVWDEAIARGTLPR